MSLEDRTLGASPASIWGYATRSLTDKAGFSIASGGLPQSEVDKVWLTTTRSLTALADAAFAYASVAGGASLTLDMATWTKAAFTLCKETVVAGGYADYNPTLLDANTFTMANTSGTAKNIGIVALKVS